jgi:hypothetical protein
MTKLSSVAQIFRQWTTMTKTPRWIYVGNPPGRFRHFPSRVGQTPHFSSLRMLKPAGRSSGEAPA